MTTVLPVRVDAEVVDTSLHADGEVVRAPLLLMREALFSVATVSKKT